MGHQAYHKYFSLFCGWGGGWGGGLQITVLAHEAIEMGS